MLILNENLRENTPFADRDFQFNIFQNHSVPFTNAVLYHHWHDHMEIIYMLSGNAVFNIGCAEYEVAPGDIILVNSGEHHSGCTINNTRVEYIAIVFNKSILISPISNPNDMKYMAPFTESRFIFPNKISIKDANHYYIEQNLLGIINEFEKKSTGFELAIKACLYLLTVFIFRNYHDTNENKEKKELYSVDMEKFRELFKYFEEHLTEKATIDQAARMVNLSPSHFCKVFKKITGRTFVEFLNLCKINKAESLLQNSSTSITEIAEKVGFCNINYFGKIFKQFRGYPPSKCRKPVESLI